MSPVRVESLPGGDKRFYIEGKIKPIATAEVDISDEDPMIKLRWGSSLDPFALIKRFTRQFVKMYDRLPSEFQGIVEDFQDGDPGILPVHFSLIGLDGNSIDLGYRLPDGMRRTETIEQEMLTANNFPREFKSGCVWTIFGDFEIGNRVNEGQGRRVSFTSPYLLPPVIRIHNATTGVNLRDEGRAAFWEALVGEFPDFPILNHQW